MDSKIRSPLIETSKFARSSSVLIFSIGLPLNSLNGPAEPGQSMMIVDMNMEHGCFSRFRKLHRMQDGLWTKYAAVSRVVDVPIVRNCKIGEWIFEQLSQANRLFPYGNEPNE
jgi:hypothetical protein